MQDDDKPKPTDGQPGKAPDPFATTDGQSGKAPAPPATTDGQPGKAPDPFANLSSFRLKQDFSDPITGVKKHLTYVAVRKPRPQDFVRVHPGEDYRMGPVGVVIVKDGADKGIYLVTGEMVEQLIGETKPVIIRLGISRQAVPFLWPVPLAGPDGTWNDWHRQQWETSNRAETAWVRMKSDMEAGCYEVHTAPQELPEPEWPPHTLEEYIRVGFRNNLINTADHPLVKRLRGLS